jgi:hypothetical protein
MSDKQTVDNHRGWIGVDLDGTLAHYDGWKGIEHIGAPIPLMAARVRNWLSEGKDVRIFTARVCDLDGRDTDLARHYIQEWCLFQLGQKLPVTNVKEFGMIELWDDRAVQVQLNTGRRVE